MSIFEGNRALLDAFRRGDEVALTRVYLHYSDEVARFLARDPALKGSRESAGGAPGVPSGRASLRPVDLQAAHQEAFIRAFQPRLRLGYDGIRPFLPLLLTVARCAAIDLLRADGKLSRESVSFEQTPQLTELPLDAPGPERDALDSEFQRLVAGFLGDRSEQERRLVRLRFVEDVAQEDAAARLELTRSELRTRERRLREAFARYLQDRGWLDAAGA
jgi:RNA polymerase sigma-70 factor (ECF subfamily)